MAKLQLCAGSGGWKRQLAFYVHHSRVQDVWATDSKQPNDDHFILRQAPKCIFMQRLFRQEAFWCESRIRVLTCKHVKIDFPKKTLWSLWVCFIAFHPSRNIQSQYGRTASITDLQLLYLKGDVLSDVVSNPFFIDTVSFNHPLQRERL